VCLLFHFNIASIAFLAFSWEDTIAILAKCWHAFLNSVFYEYK
jgi:hypothetical protein